MHFCIYLRCYGKPPTPTNFVLALAAAVAGGGGMDMWAKQAAMHVATHQQVHEAVQQAAADAGKAAARWVRPVRSWHSLGGS